MEKDGISIVGICDPGDRTRLMSDKKAAELAGRLHGIGETELAGRISKAAQQAEQANKGLAFR